jgi:hypothetical protein
MLQSWRGNCDLQLLIYNCHPDKIDASEISRVTDYIVAYSCKGNLTQKEEIEQNKKLIMASESLTGDTNDVKRVSKQVMNLASAKRLISKQEASVLLSGLELFSCTETIESVSISNSKALRDKEDTTTNKSLIKKYRDRPFQQRYLSLYDFFFMEKGKKRSSKEVIPHFVGISGTPTYPVTENYARHVLTVYRPWIKYPENLQWIEEFERFMNSGRAPSSAQMHYLRVMNRYFDRMLQYEPKSTHCDHTKNPITSEDQQLIDLLGLKATDDVDYDTSLIKQLNRGLDFEWDKPAEVSSVCNVQRNFKGIFSSQRKMFLSVRFEIFMTMKWKFHPRNGYGRKYEITKHISMRT